MRYGMILTPLAVCWLALGAVVAAPAQEDAALEEEIAAASAPELTDPQLSVEEAINAFFLSDLGKQLKAREARGELYVGYGVSEIKVGPENPQWGKHRVAAYENALIEAENEFVRRRGLSLQAEKVREFFSDTDSPIPDFQPDDLASSGKAGRIFSKLLSVAEGRLDKELEELGVNEQEFQDAQPAQRHTMFREALAKTSTREAIGELVGIIPMKTFEAYNTAGEHVIGVVVVQSPGMKRFADQILHARGDMQPVKSRAGRPVYEVITEKPAALVDEFGLRRLYDEDGYPVLISFGQSANAYTGADNRKRRRYRDAAQKVAESSADASIAFFVAGKSSWTDENSIEELLEEAVKVHPDGFREQDNITTVINRVRETSRARARANITGLTTVHTWAMAHPLYPEQEVVGVVRMYSPKSEITARQLDRPSSSREQKVEVEAAEQDGIRSSKDRMDIHDF